jgi:hypothetical protein
MNANEILTERYFIYDNRRKVRRATGVFVGFFDNEANKVRTGFSRCNVIAGDKFDMHSGVAYAVQQAIFQNVWVKDNVDNQDFWDHYINFVDRCNRYFKQGLADVPVNDRGNAKINSILDLIMNNGLGVADKAGFDLLKGNYPNCNAKNVHIVKNKEEEVKKIEGIIQKIKEQFNLLGYNEDKITGIINSLGVAGIADAEGIKLLKKHFPKIDTSKIEVLEKKEEKKNDKDKVVDDIVETIYAILGLQKA